MATPIKTKAIVEKIVDHDGSVRSLYLKPERRIPKFRPGQFVHLAIDEYDPSSHWPESRAYSIASSPEERDHVLLTISRKGPFSQRIFDMKEGAEVWLKLPYGEFVVEATANQEVVLIGGGTGITPFASLIASNEPCYAKLRVVYGAQRPELFIYRDVIEKGRGTDYRSKLILGMLSMNEIALMVDDVSKAIWYLSGPVAMIDFCRNQLLKWNVPQEHIRVDEWG